MTDWRHASSLAVASDDCTQCGWATWELVPGAGHWLCGHDQVRAEIGRERIAIGVARETCRGAWHTKARGAPKGRA